MTNIQGNFPNTRLRRNRMKDFSRRLVAENNLGTSDLILPLFVCEGNNIEDPIQSMPGVSRYSIDKLLNKVEHAVRLSIPAIAIFPQIEASLKNAEGSIAIDPFTDEQINPNSYNLRLHPDLLVYDNDILDMREKNSASPLVIPEGGLLLEPHKLYLGRTVERTSTDKYVPMLEGRSSVGLSLIHI